jgi:uncharacterized RDD family membrane protein YckC
MAGIVSGKNFLRLFLGPARVVGGRMLGKRAVGIEVVRVDFGPISWRKAAPALLVSWRDNA